MAAAIIIPILAVGMIVFGWATGRYGGGVSTSAVQERATSRARRGRKR